MLGCTLVWMPMKTPPAAASPAPMIQVQRITCSTLMPETRARSASSLTARIALPSRVRLRKRCSATTKAAVTSTIVTWRGAIFSKPNSIGNRMPIS